MWDGDYVKPLKDLTNEKDLSKVSLKYCHEVLFDCKDDENRWVMREEPERYNCYIDNDLRCNSVRQGTITLKITGYALLSILIMMIGD
mgnify:CR=1 FL=1